MESRSASFGIPIHLFGFRVRGSFRIDVRLSPCSPSPIDLLWLVEPTPLSKCFDRPASVTPTLVSGRRAGFPVGGSVPVLSLTNGSPSPPRWLITSSAICSVDSARSVDTRSGAVVRHGRRRGHLVAQWFDPGRRSTGLHGSLDRSRHGPNPSRSRPISRLPAAYLVRLVCLRHRLVRWLLPASSLAGFPRWLSPLVSPHSSAE